MILVPRYTTSSRTRLWGIAVATSNVREMYARFPEVVQMGGTFKTNCFEYYHEDGVVALRTVLVDRDYKEINAWQKIFPDLRVLLCQVC